MRKNLIILLGAQSSLSIKFIQKFSLWFYFAYSCLGMSEICKKKNNFKTDFFVSFCVSVILNTIVNSWLKGRSKLVLMAKYFNSWNEEPTRCLSFFAFELVDIWTVRLEFEFIYFTFMPSFSFLDQNVRCQTKFSNHKNCRECTQSWKRFHFPLQFTLIWSSRIKIINNYVYWCEKMHFTKRVRNLLRPLLSWTFKAWKNFIF